LSDRSGWTDAKIPRQRNLQKFQDRPDGRLIIIAQFFVFDVEGLDPDPLKKTQPQFFLSLGLLKTLLDQFTVELWFAQSSLSLLDFPKPGLQSARRGQSLPELVTPHYVHEAETRKSILEKVTIACAGITENTCSPQPNKEIVQVPAHQFKAEDFV
jgi:hypothetical protein